MKALVYLESVGCMMDIENQIVYPLMHDGNTDLLSGVEVSELTEEFLDRLSLEDYYKLFGFSGA